MVKIRSRSEANLPPVPASVGHRSLSSWQGIRIHHTGGAFSSWRAVHNWQTAGRPPSEQLVYIGYSFGISAGDVWTLRGFDHQPAHDFINTHLGLVVGGDFEIRLPSDEDLDALVWFIREAEQRCQKRLPVSAHRDAGQTTCPGGRLHQWIKQKLPGRLAAEEDDMPTAQEIARAVRDELTVVTTEQHWSVRAGLHPAGKTIDPGTGIELGWGYAKAAWRLLPELASAAEVAELRGQVAGLTALVQQALIGGPSPLTPEQLQQLIEAVTTAAREPGERIAAQLAAAGRAVAVLEDDELAGSGDR